MFTPVVQILIREMHYRPFDPPALAGGTDKSPALTRDVSHWPLLPRFAAQGEEGYAGAADEHDETASRA